MYLMPEVGTKKKVQYFVCSIESLFYSSVSVIHIKKNCSKQILTIKIPLLTLQDLSYIPMKIRLIYTL